MAKLIPSLNSCLRRMTTGEKRVARILESTYSLINNLCRDPALTEHEGDYKGKLVCPYAFGVVLTGITRNEFDSSDLGRVLPEHLVICRDEMTESTDPEAFQKRLWDMFPTQFPRPLSLPQIDRVRWHLFPKIRINPPEQLLIGSDQANDQRPHARQNIPSIVVEKSLTHVDAKATESSELFPDIIKVMDLEQETLARSLGDGHRVIHGVAGSGKTLILGYRCVHLANTYVKPVLVLCFNVTLAAKLREFIQINDLADRVQVRHFHDWCGDQLRTYHVAKPLAGNNYVKALVQTVIDATESSRIPRAQYGAVMIDEGHDFEPDWLRLVVSMIDPDTNSLLLLYDDAQSIYTKRSLGFSLSSVGVQAVGRTKILRINYRNTDEILNYAYQFASKWLSGEELDDDQITTVTPETAGRHGPNPVFKLCPGFEKEVQLITKCIKEQHSKGMPWSDICVAYRANWMGEKLHEAMKSAGLPVHWLRSKADKTRLSSSDSSIKLELRGMYEWVSLDEVAQVYLPLSRLPKFYVASIQQLNEGMQQFMETNTGSETCG